MVKNIILQNCINNNPHYVHALEVESLQDLKDIITELMMWNYPKESLIEFVNTLSIYCTNEDNEDEVYNFDITTFLNDL